MRDFLKLDVWRKSHELVLTIYRFTEMFPKHERFGLTEQIRRAAVSVPSNIAEGSGHKSENQFGRYLQLAVASASEVQYQVILAKDLGYLNSDGYHDLSIMVVEVKKMLYGLLTKLTRDRNQQIAEG